MDALYYVTMAAVMATMGISVIVGKTLEKLSENPKEIEKLKNKMFLEVAGLEVIPIILVVLSFVHIEQATAEKGIPLFFVIGSLLLSLFLLFTKRKEVLGVTKEKETKNHINILFACGIALIFAFPVIAFVVIAIP